MSIIQSILDRLKEPSSYAGLAVLLSFFGVNVAPEGWALVVTAATAVCAAAAFFIREKAK